MQMNPYLTFDGQCEAAFKFYARCLGGEIVQMLPYGEMPMGDSVPPDFRDKIAHGRLVVDGQVLMASDGLPKHPYEGITGCSVTLNVDTPEEAERIFQALAENGNVQMPMEETFWAARFGMLVDQFGVPWMVNCEKAA